VKPDVAAFAREKLGYEPRNLGLFELALTHKSVGGGQDYERLEFLGDRVLGMVIANALYERYPDEPEGYLSRRGVRPEREILRRENPRDQPRAEPCQLHVR
jgi:ribonuclease-3